MPKWLLYATISMLIWALWSLLSPLASRGLSGSLVQILSSGGLVPFAVVLLFSKNLKRGTHMGKGSALALATGVTAGLGNIMLYNALGVGGPASLVFPIVSLAPVIPVLTSPFLFKEKIRGIQLAGIVIALIAIFLLNMSPSSTPKLGSVRLFSGWMVYAMLALIIFGVTFITQKGATYFISDELSTVVYTVGFVVLDLALFVIAPAPSLNWKIPAIAGWVSVFIGVLMGAGTLTLFAAYRYGKASIVTPFSQLFPILTVLIAVPLYHEHLDLLRCIGIAAALGGGIILSLEKSTPPASLEAADG